MKIIYYLIGVLLLFYLFSIYYEDKREKDFLKRDLELSEKELVEINTSTLNKDKANEHLKNQTTFLNEFDNNIKNEIKRKQDDAKGAIPLRLNN